MNNKFAWSLVYELLWFVVAAVVAYILVLPVKNEISQQFTQYLIASVFLILTYFRFVAFMQRSILLESIWMKLLLFVLNVPLFFFVLNKYYEFGRVYDEYNYTLPAGVFQHIKSGTELDDLMYIKHLVTFAGVAALMLIILLEIRIVYAIFKLRQLDKVIYRNK